MKNMTALFLLCALAFRAVSHEVPGYQFETFYPHGKDVHDLVKKSFRQAWPWVNDLFLNAELKSTTKLIKLEGRDFLLTHYYLVGEGFSDDKFESLQYITFQEKGSEYIIFQSGPFMPECGRAKWNLDEFKVESPGKDSNRIIITIERIIFGCAGETGTITVYKATYDLGVGKLEHLIFEGRSL